MATQQIWSEGYSMPNVMVSLFPLSSMIGDVDALPSAVSVRP